MRVRERTVFRLLMVLCVIGSIGLIGAALYAPLPLPSTSAQLKSKTPKVKQQDSNEPQLAAPELEAFNQFADWELQRPLFDPPPKVEPPPPPKPKIPPPQVELYSVAMSGDAPARATFIDPEGVYLNRSVGETVSDQRVTAVVSSITKDYVMLEHNDELVKLTFSSQ